MNTRFIFQATGTTWQIDIESSVESTESPNSFKLVEQTVREWLESYENTYSRFRPDSLLSRIAGARINPCEYTFPEEAKELFALYRKMYEATGGLVTPLIGQVISDAGYDAKYSLIPKSEIPQAKKWDDVMSYEHPILKVREAVLLDFGAIGKGYAIDCIGKLLKENDISNYVINAGGDILHSGDMGSGGVSSVRVGLEHPYNPKQVIGVALVSNKSICGSSGNRRAWDKYHHIINPDTASSPNHISAVWVITQTAALADALTTGLFFIEPSILSQRLGISFEYLIVYTDNTMKKSPGFTAEIF